MGCVYQECDTCVFHHLEYPDYPCDECYNEGYPHYYQPASPEDDDQPAPPENDDSEE